LGKRKPYKRWKIAIFINTIKTTDWGIKTTNWGIKTTDWGKRIKQHHIKTS